ncbi:MAG: GMC family oxidoreductase [Actinobacteria bacterium]|nr:GMC family oxidoreductase [Actinomycetota bacterium]
MNAKEVPDVLIIGAGASGGVAAKHLAEEGLSVVILEQGNWVDPSDMPGLRPEYELLGSGPWHPNPNVRNRAEDYPINLDDSVATVGMFNGVGGSTVLYASCWCRAKPSDFRVHTLDGVADDWPISYEELVPYYQQVEWELGISGQAENPAYPSGYVPPLPSLPINMAGRVMAQGMNKLGWHWWPGYNSIASRDHGHQKQCQRLGVCMYGCPEGAKGSSDVALIPHALAHGARLETGARVARVTLDENGRANGAIYYKDGKEHFQPAKVVLIGANGIGTPRLLLMSESNRFRDGLANSSGLVGKRFMTHPFGTSVGLYEDDLEDWVGPTGEAIESMQFYETDTSRGFVRGSKWHIIPSAGRPLGMINRFTMGEGGVADEPFWGESFNARMRSSIGHLIEWMIMPDDLPEETNFISLDPSMTDSDGLPAAKVTYVTSENTHRLVDWNLQRSLEAHEAAGATKAWITNRNNPSWHNIGTAKMGDDPQTSVVDRWGRTHDVPNLYIIDGSQFPTATGVNPTATICALAKRTATFIANNRDQVVAW